MLPQQKSIMHTQTFFYPDGIFSSEINLIFQELKFLENCCISEGWIRFLKLKFCQKCTHHRSDGNDEVCGGCKVLHSQMGRG